MPSSNHRQRPGGAPARRRAERVFLWTLVGSLVTCAAVAVAVLLFWEFNATTWRILGTLVALAIHSGVAMASTHALERRWWPHLSRLGLVLFGLNFAVLMACTWWPGPLDDTVGRAWLMTGSLLGYYVLAIPGAALYEKRRLVPLALLALGTCAVGFVMLVVCIWAERVENVTFGKATAIVAVAAFTLAHTCVLLRAPTARQLGWLQRAAVYAAWATGALAAVMIALELDEEFPFRLLGALGVTDASASLALVIMTKLRRVQRIESLASAAAELEIVCPRCTTRQTVPAGASRCQACGLKFRIEIEEARCARCDYVLWQLPERRCPECGLPF